MTMHNRVFLDVISNDEHHNKDPEVVSNVISKELVNIKYKCFGKVKFKSQSSTDKKLDSLHSDKIKYKNPHEEEICNE